MEDFCNGEPFWDTNLTLSSSWPRLTGCFIDTALVWAPCGGLWVATPIYLFYLSLLVTRPYRHTPLQQVKLFAGIMLCILGAVEIISVFSEKHRQEDPVYISADILAPVVRTCTFMLAVGLIVLERKKDLITSGVLFFFWFFMTVLNIVPFYTNIILQTFKQDMTSFCVFYISHVFMLVEFVAHCFAEKSADDINSSFPCPEVKSSYLSRLTFSWTTGLMLEGYRKSLTELDVYDLHPREQSDNIIRKFEKAVDSFRGVVTKPLSREEVCARYSDSTASVSLGYRGYKRLGDEDTESTPLLSSERGSIRSPSADHGQMPPLWKILCKTFGLDALLAQSWKVVNDVLMLLSPLILRALIDFTSDLNSPEWVGYLLSLGIFVSVTVQAVTFHVLNHYSMAIGIRVRAALISAIFRKGLTINNEASKECSPGEIVNLMSVDVTRIQKYAEQLYWIWAAPVEVIVCLYLLHDTLGDAMLAGLAFLLVTIAVNIVLMTRMGSLQAKLMRTKDKRIKLVNEVLNGIKILKLYAWEESFRDKIDRIRQRELQVIWKIAVLQAVLTAVSVLTPFCVGLFTFVLFIFLNDSHTLDAATAFVGLSLFNTMKNPLTLAPRFFSDTAKCVISVGRVNRFLQLPDLRRKPHTSIEDGFPIIVSNGTFSWDFDRPPTLTNINLRVPEGSLVAVVGQVGSGKTSLISAIVGDMETISGHVTINGRVAYSPQQAWIQNDTVQNNILFGKAMHRRNYIKVIHACALKQDIDKLPGKDKTEIGEKGINLSGGQKQRVSLARAVYNDADIYLLDDPLSAVDSHVGKHIFTKVISKTGLLMHKTRVLVTHGVHWLPHVDLIVVMTDGKISEMGSYNALMSHHGAFSQFLMTYFTEPKDQSDGGEDEFVQEMEKAVFERLRVLHSAESEGSTEEDIFEKTIHRMRRASLLEGLTSSTRLTLMRRRDSRVQIKGLDKLIEEETVQAGMVKKAVYVTYGRALGVTSALLVVGFYLLYQAGSVGGSVWLSTWTDDPQLTNTSLPSDSPNRGVRTDFFMGIYGLFGILQILTIFLSTLLLAVSSVRASRSVHTRVLGHVLRAPMSFFDTTPIGRILNRFSQDIDTIDNELPVTLITWTGRVCSVLSTIIVISYTTPIFLSAVLPISVLYTLIQRFYIPTSRQLRRLESKTRSPIYAHFGETLTGSSVIRAYRAEGRFIRHSEKLVDMNQKFTFASNTSNRWLGVRIEVLGALVVFLASLLAVITRSARSGGVVGLSISYALDITISLNWLVRLTSDIETQIVAIERLKEYTETETEAALRRYSTCPPSYWPSRGEVQFERYSTRFRPGLDLVLRSITCKIRPGEKVGVVGRTGAGKSSLALALFRLIEPAGGDILVDGYSIRNLGLHSLRERITILPQDPVIFDGTLRMNLDPFGESRDNQMWVALGQANLKDFVERLPTGLDYECGEGGENLSVGQRQLVCLARTLLRKTKVLVLDEATAAVDLETDDLIQQTIRTEFKHCTVISIAHRLNTIMDYDRVMVLDQGRIVDFNPPEIMLKNINSLFYKLAKDANII